MKNIVETINNNSINEARELQYGVSVMNILDHDGLPVTIKMSCDAKYKTQMENWINSLIDNEFTSATAYNYDWEPEI